MWLPWHTEAALGEGERFHQSLLSCMLCSLKKLTVDSIELFKPLFLAVLDLVSPFFPPPFVDRSSPLLWIEVALVSSEVLAVWECPEASLERLVRGAGSLVKGIPGC